MGVRSAPSLLCAAGIGASFVPATIAATSGVASAESGLATGVLSTAYQAGSSLGVAVLAAIAAHAAPGDRVRKRVSRRRPARLARVRNRAVDARPARPPDLAPPDAPFVTARSRTSRVLGPVRVRAQFPRQGRGRARRRRSRERRACLMSAHRSNSTSRSPSRSRRPRASTHLTCPSCRSRRFRSLTARSGELSSPGRCIAKSTVHEPCKPPQKAQQAAGRTPSGSRRR